MLALATAKTPPEPLGLVPIRGVWTLALNSHITLPPAYDATRAYFAIEENRLVAYELASGKQIWLVEARPLSQPVSDGHLLYMAEADALVARRVEDGAVAWRTPLEEALAGRPAVEGGTIAGITKSGAVLTFKAADGTIAWRHDVGAAPHAPATISGDRVYASFPGRILALRREDGHPVWERNIGGLPNEIVALPDRVYVGSTDNFFYCLLAKDGQIDWRWRTGADVVGPAVTDARRVYFVSLDNVLRVLDRVSGGQQWMKALPIRPTSGPVLAGPTVMVAGQSATIKAFMAKDGAPAVDIPAGDEVVAPLLVAPFPDAPLPMLVTVTRHIVRGDAVALSVRSMEPPVLPIAPLPNPIMPAPTQTPAPRP